jgi:hypothetical protein
MNNQDLTINGLHSTFNDCWNQIGVTGDRSCEELKSYMHCHNCPVYSAAGRGLLEREVPPEYLKQWTEILSETSTDPAGEKTKLALVGTSAWGQGAGTGAPPLPPDHSTNVQRRKKKVLVYWTFFYASVKQQIQEISPLSLRIDQSLSKLTPNQYSFKKEFEICGTKLVIASSSDIQFPSY